EGCASNESDANERNVGWRLRFTNCVSRPRKPGQISLRGGLSMTVRRKSIRLVFTRLSVSLFCLFLSIGQAFTQEFRGSMIGRVSDSTGASVVGARITVTNVGMNTSTTVKSDEGGNYSAFYLTPGQYTVTVEVQGFKKLVRQGVEVRIADRLTLDLVLEVGAVQEMVNVSAEAPLLESASASAGQVIDGRRISDLPLSDRNPFTLARLAPGIAYTGDLKFSRPFDNQGASAVVANGSPGRNEFTLDGSPNMANGDGQGGVGRVAFVPPADAVQEFKVVT